MIKRELLPSIQFPISRPELKSSWQRAAKLGVIFFLFLGFSMANAAEFTLTSSNFSSGGRVYDAQVFNGFGCNGKNVSPELSWRGAPKGTKSFALLTYDPDAPTGSGWWHWVVFNIPATVSSLPEGAGDLKAGLIPEATQSRTDYNSLGYGGPCPPEGDGDHRYQFKLFALNVEQLPLDENSPAAMVGFYANAHKLAETELEVKYSR
ncbi:MAG: YbhB/YbcL family Raf kinase inhibitor-like protein [Gammaproteobacteria bacterium]|nr:YbhB/YbcL family Raf kinase inhibitor-like protein [Gammaproteobacteria bacterium]